MVSAMLVRLQKYLAEAGVASRRAGEQMITAGRITVNDVVITRLGTRVDAVHDRVMVDGVRVKPKRKLYLAVHKPRGYVCTRSDPQGRPIIGSLLPKEWGSVYSIGRLDRDSEGLILMTNDGDFCLKVSHPRYGIRKVYRVTVKGMISGDQLDRLRKGVQIDGEDLRVHRARVLRGSNQYSFIEVELAEGKNREVRRLMEALGTVVERLERIRIGTIALGELKEGRWRTLTDSEIKSLLALL
jgi:23S rRNA pseudouridine2605 synthase